MGKILVHGASAARIVETEGYLGLSDAAAHASAGRTTRTEVIFGPPGHAYVYLIYGVYECLNVVAEADGSPGCVLVRALEPLQGIGMMHKRRPGVRRVEDIANGPGKLTLAMGITRRHNGADLTIGPLKICAPPNEEPFEIAISPRIGITKNVDWPLRFFIAGNRFVSGRGSGNVKDHVEKLDFQRI